MFFYVYIPLGFCAFYTKLCAFFLCNILRYFAHVVGPYFGPILILFRGVKNPKDMPKTPTKSHRHRGEMEKLDLPGWSKNR